MRRLKWIDGQGLVEFALVLPILLFLVLGAVDIGRAYFIKVMLENSAREGAYYMVNNIAGASDITMVNAVKALAKEVVVGEARNSDSIDTPFTQGNVNITCLVGATENSLCPSGSTVIVSVEYTFKPVMSIFFKNPLKLVNDARMLIP